MNGMPYETIGGRKRFQKNGFQSIFEPFLSDRVANYCRQKRPKNLINSRFHVRHSFCNFPVLTCLVTKRHDR